MKSPEDDLGLSGKVALRYRTTINDYAAVRDSHRRDDHGGS